MAFHVQISGHGFSMKSSTKYNLSRSDVEEHFVHPWDAGADIVVGGKVFAPSESQIMVREGPELDVDIARGLTAWLVVTETCEVVTDEFISRPPGSRSPESDAAGPVADLRRVAVVHGRDSAAKDSLFALLRALDLRPLEWTELIRVTGSAAPSNRNVVEQLFALAQAVVVLATPDDEVRLHPDLVPNPDSRGEGSMVCQPRANVLLEAGMALALHPDRTVFVEVGVCRLPSDLDGTNVVRLDGTVPPLHDLAQRLESAGCEVSRDGTDWLEARRFAELDARLRLPSTDG